MERGKFEHQPNAPQHWCVTGKVFFKLALYCPYFWGSNISVSVSRQLPHRCPQGARRHLPQSGHPAPRGSSGCSAFWLLQRRVSGQGQRVSLGLLGPPVHTQHAFGWQRPSAGSAKSLRRPEEVRGGWMFAGLTLIQNQESPGMEI